MAEEIKQPTEIKQETKTETKVEEKKEEKKVVVKRVNKNYALVNARNINMSTKEAGHICDMIRWKKVDDAIKMVEEVIVFIRPVKMTAREYPHQHGKGVAGAGYPINAAKEFVKALKQLKANAIYNELDLDNHVITCKADKASRPYRRGGARFKRTHLMLKLIKNDKKVVKKENKKTEAKSNVKKTGAKK